MLLYTGKTIKSDWTPHTAVRGEQSWTVSWLPAGRVVDSEQAVVAMRIAEALHDLTGAERCGTLYELDRLAPGLGYADIWTALEAVGAGLRRQGLIDCDGEPIWPAPPDNRAGVHNPDDVALDLLQAWGDDDEIDQAYRRHFNAGGTEEVWNQGSTRRRERDLHTHAALTCRLLTHNPPHAHGGPGQLPGT